MIHIIGGGLAGLASAVAVMRADRPVILHEAAPVLGGRCRSLFCPQVGRVIDTGSHLLLGANRTALAFAKVIGGDIGLISAEPVFPFFDLPSRHHWSLSPRRLTTGWGETVRALGLPFTSSTQTVTARLGSSRSFPSVWRPLCEAMLNTAPEEASAALFCRTLRTILLGGAEAMRPLWTRDGLSSVFADPAQAALEAGGVEIRLGHRLLGLDSGRLTFSDGDIRLSPKDRVILALPPWSVNTLLPRIETRLPTRGILNLHFRLEAPASLPGGSAFLGVTGGKSQWIFLRGDIVSVTISALARENASPDLAQQVWEEIRAILSLPAMPLPAHRIIHERRATLAHTCAVVKQRPPPVTEDSRVVLAGDWLASPLPCTLEAAIFSGLAAARRVTGQQDLKFV